MLRFYRQLLKLYPIAHRQQFGEEMLAVFVDLGVDSTTKKFFTRAIFIVREILGLIAGACGEHMRCLFDADSGFLLQAFSLRTRSFVMRKGFRFPKSTAFLMTIILAGVCGAIRKGEVIATTRPPFSQPITPIHPAHSYLLSGVVAGFLFFYAVGLAGWAIVFALRRS